MQLNIRKIPFPNERINALFTYLEDYAKVVYKRKGFDTTEALYNGFNKYISRRDQDITMRLLKDWEFSEYIYDLFSRFLENPHCLLSLADSDNPPFKDDIILHRL